MKREAKVKAAAFIEQRTGVKVSPDAMFDVQVRAAARLLALQCACAAAYTTILHV